MQITQGVHPLPIDPGSTVQNLVSFAPGRVNLIGEHTDYNGGMVMPAALNLGIHSSLKLLTGRVSEVFVASRSSNATLHLTGNDIRLIANQLLDTGVEKSDAVRLNELDAHGWSKYLVGCFAIFEATLRTRQFERMPWHDHSLSIILDSDLPQGAGLSSSAALCISILGQLNTLAGVPLDAAIIARLAMYVEHRFAGTKCGLMDQLAVLCSRADHFTRIDFLEFPVSQGFHISYAKAHEAFHNHSLVIFKTGVNHSLAESAYNERRASCENALKQLNKKLGLGAHSLGELARLPRFQAIATEAEYLIQLETLLEDNPESKTLAKRACHAMLENSRVMAAAKALSSGDLLSLANAMRASHKSLDQLYEVTCPELNSACSSMEAVVRELCRTQPALATEALVGSRMTGGGFGGSTIQLVHRGICDALVERFASTSNPYTQATGILPKLYVCQPSTGFSTGLETID
ncbi:MAG: galactokinase [Silvanigrellaceae bacterium]